MFASDSKDSNFLINFLLGGVVPGISKTVVAPIERVKLLLQLQDAKKGMEDASKKYKGVFNCIARVRREQGFLSFWRGNLSNVIRHYPSQILGFVFRGKIQKIFPSCNPETHYWKFIANNMAAGGLAGSLSLFVLYPLDFIRTRLATDTGKTGVDREFKGMGDVIMKIVKSDGVYGIYRGFGISVIGIFFSRALYFGMLDSRKTTLNEHFGIASFFAAWAFAQLITVTSGILSYPFDTIRRRMMMQSGRSDVLYASTLDCIKKIYVTEGGIKPFFKGVGCNLIRGAGGAIVFALLQQA